MSKRGEFVDELQARIEKLEALCLRWNKAVAAAGVVGSEYVDESERAIPRIYEHGVGVGAIRLARAARRGVQPTPKEKPDE